jgi:hypothetical protein
MSLLLFKLTALGNAQPATRGWLCSLAIDSRRGMAVPLGNQPRGLAAALKALFFF